MHRNRSATHEQRFAIERLEARVALDASLLQITELLASNDDGLKDYDGDASDWVEIYNPSGESVDLSGLYLTDNDDNLRKWAFPSGAILPAGGYRLVFASNKDTVKPGGELHASFALGAGGEYLALVAADGATVIDEYRPEFPEQMEDVSYGLAMNPGGSGSSVVASFAQGRAWAPTDGSRDAVWMNRGYDDAHFNIVGQTGFGYEAAPGDPVNFTAELRTNVPVGATSLYVRIPFTLDSLAGVSRLTLRMNYDDGFVAYVNGAEVAAANAPDSPQWDSAAAAVQDDAAAKVFREFDASAVIPYLVAGENVLAIHALNASSTSSDLLVLPELAVRSSDIDSPEARGFFETPTPGFANGAPVLGFVEEPTFSAPHGFYDAVQWVSLATATPGATIVYTTDGSTPAVNASLNPTNGTRYTGPIVVSATTVVRAVAFKQGFKPSDVAASTYLFLEDVIRQSPQGQTPPGWAVSGTNGQAMNYGMDPDIISLYGAEAVKDSLRSLPTIAISTDLGNLFDPRTGIYVNATFDGRDWERPANVELINSDGAPGFSVNAGLRIRGGYSRGDFNPKHAFRFYFRNEYGDGRLHHPLFGEEGVAEFDVIDLRSEQNYAWSSEGNVQHTLLREVFARDLQRDLEEPYTRSRYYHLYVDGVYWGVSQTQERVEEFYGESYFGGDSEDYDVLKSGLADVGGTQLNAGNDDAWRQLFTLAQNLANSPILNADNYWAMQGLNPDGTRNPAMPVLLDVDNLINYMLIIFYTGGYDTGLSAFLGDNKANNWYGVYNRVAADEGFQFFIHDNEHSLGASSNLHGSQFIDRTGPFNHGNQGVYAQFNPHYLHQDLLAHPEYRYRIVEKVQEYFFSGGPMTPEASVARLQERIPQVEGAIIAESARWGDAQTPSSPRTKAHWQNEVDWLLHVYFPSRTATVVNQLKADRLYVTPPTLTPAGGAVGRGSQVTMTISSGELGVIYYTTDGATDPRLPGGGVNRSPAVNAYSGPLTLTGDAVVKARFHRGGQWSTLVDSSFTAVNQGDYDSDGDVDGRDFLRWQRELGTSGHPAGSGADGDASGVVDAGDLAVWSAHFGREYSAPGDLTAAAEAPEANPRDAAYASLAAYADVVAKQDEARHSPTGRRQVERPAQDLAFSPHTRKGKERLPSTPGLAYADDPFLRELDATYDDGGFDFAPDWAALTAWELRRFE